MPPIRLIDFYGLWIVHSEGWCVMAKMIPARIEDSNVSAGERKVFDLLKTDGKTTDWTVLHSLGLARRSTGPFGEIDFVVIIPKEGVVCLEVKGGRVSCEAGEWKTMDRYGKVASLKKSPFLQAREAMFSLRDAIIQHFGENASESQCPIGCVVVFPDVVCPPITPEFERSDVIDIDDLRRPISKSIMRLVRNRLHEFRSRGAKLLPTIAQVKAISNFLRPDFDRVVAKGMKVGHTEDKILRLTEEQYARLDELEENPRCLFEGAAGTGKTLLALEFSRRASQSGLKVLTVCYNRLLGEWLQQQSRQVANGRIEAGTWHSVARSLILKSDISSEFAEKEREAFDNGDVGQLFDELYPFYSEMALEELGTLFDVLVVDEAQDLCRQHILGAFDSVIPGGLSQGQWAFFGDFTRQALYDAREEPAVALTRYSKSFVRAKLTLNCRNTRRIAEETVLVAGFDGLPFRLGEEVGLPVEYRYWERADDLVESLANVVERLVKEGVSVADIVILSPRRLNNSSLANCEKIFKFPVVDISRGMTAKKQVIRFSTIHAFKGLESPVVIVADIVEVDERESQSLIYVAMSRARSLLVLMVHEKARKPIQDRIKAAMRKGYE